MSFPATRLAAAALAAAALAAWPGEARARAPEGLAAIDAEVQAIEDRLAAAERFGLRQEEEPAVHAQRRFEDGVEQYELGDWLHAAIMIDEAVDEPAWEGAPDRGEATFLLADALRRQGLCGAARLRYQDYLARADAPRRTEALSGALDCAVKERRQRDVETLLEQNRALGEEAPPELRYLLAKAAYQRTDLPKAQRIAAASEAFAKVGKPFELQALYFQGVLRIEAEDLSGALPFFERCAGAASSGDRDGEVRDLCALALGRIHSELGEPDRALSSYAAVPFTSPHFAEAAYETALAYVKAKRYDEALEMTSFVPDLDPESPLAPEAMVVRGHLLLRLGRYAEATETYNAVINTYAPVRDEIDAILATGEDPMRYYDELAGRKGSAFELASMLPPVAVKWATQSREVAGAVAYVRSIESAREEVAEARDLAVRLESLLERGGGIDAFTSLQRTYAHAQAVENAAARAEGSYVAAAADVALRALHGQRQKDLERAREARSRIERRFEALPRTPFAVEERLAAMRARVDEALETLHRLAIVQQSCLVDIDGIDGWLDKNRAEIHGDEPSRQELNEELKRQRAIVEEYDGEIGEMRRQIAAVRDSAGGVDSMVQESKLRADYLAAVERERGLAEEARGSLEGKDLEVFERMDRGSARLSEFRTRARSLKLGVASEATRRAESFRRRIAAERLALAGQEGALEGLLQASQEVLGPIALRSISDVRGLFYRIVLKADVGIVDVAWSRKRARLEKIQGLAVRRDEELEQLDRDFRALTKEEE